MKKFLWSVPRITEIEIKMTEFNKIGTGVDMYSNMIDGLHGQIVETEDGCCCS